MSKYWIHHEPIPRIDCCLLKLKRKKMPIKKFRKTKMSFKICNSLVIKGIFIRQIITVRAELFLRMKHSLAILVVLCVAGIHVRYLDEKFIWIDWITNCKLFLAMDGHGILSGIIYVHYFRAIFQMDSMMFLHILEYRDSLPELKAQ